MHRWGWLVLPFVLSCQQVETAQEWPYFWYLCGAEKYLDQKMAHWALSNGFSSYAVSSRCNAEQAVFYAPPAQ